MEGGDGAKKEMSVMKPLLRLSAGGSGFFVACVTCIDVLHG
jgi:hypothetical protein